MSQPALKALLQSRWHGAAVHGQINALHGWTTGIESVDKALAPIGIPCGRLTEIFGAESCGKTTFAFALLAKRIAAGDLAAYVDTQGCFFAPAAHAAGIDLVRLIVARPRSTQSLLRATDALVRGGACALVVVDCDHEVLQTHHCARLVAQAEKTGTALLVLSRGRSAPLASFATLRLWARGLSPLWQSGADGGGQLCGYAIDMEIAKARTVAPGKIFSFAVHIAGLPSSWPVGVTSEDAIRPAVVEAPLAHVANQ